MGTANIIEGFGALNLDLIFGGKDVGDFSAERLRLESGREVSIPREVVDGLLDSLARRPPIRSWDLRGWGFPAGFIGKEPMTSRV